MQINKIANVSFKGVKWNTDDLTTKKVLKTLSPEHKASADILQAYLESISETNKQNITLGFQRPKAAPNSVAVYAIIQDKKYPDVRTLATIKSVQEQHLEIDGLESDYFEKFQAEALKKMDDCKHNAFNRTLMDMKK